MQRVLAVVAAAVALALPQAARPAALPDAAIENAMNVWQVPGLAIAVVQGATAVTTATFGRRDIERNLPVTPRTLFATGSITKSFTALGLAMLAEDGRLEWDIPVADLAPGVRLSGPAVTLRHMLTHRTGMPRHDALWYLGRFNRGELIHRLRYLPPAAPLGVVFAYNTLMFATAGHVAGRLAGTSWEAFTRRRILSPLGMQGAKLSLAAFLAAPDRAAAYFPAEQGRLRIAARDTDAIGPAASLYADVTDMARYVRFHLAGAAPGKRRLVRSSTARMLLTPQTAIDGKPRFPEFGPTGYAFGFYATTYRGRRMLYHPGVIDGYAGLISLLPEHRLGIIVLSNLSGRNPVPKIVTYAVYDRLLGLPPLPWTKRFKASDAKFRTAPSPAGPMASTGPPPRPAMAYTGIFEHAAYGRMGIRAEGDGLSGSLHRIRFALVHGKGDRWRVKETAWPLRKGLELTFHFGAGDTALRITTPLADGPTYRLQAGDMAFTRIGAVQ